ncbi:MAG: tRNA (N6-threonylcarbamoyladenosine(37)-N6)-methyltransferase TrmO [Clostridia bacterium]|nr:tRNA (N6-threonylcarbamoyladenosine(37)-N6)-methyltransferase TrmO [Clostridia bacterium]
MVINMELKTIAHIRTAFPTKFGVPRQSGLAESLHARIVFDEPYRNAAALRGLEGFSHIWLIWLFSEAVREDWSPTVRPPRLGGNTRMGVFATRSPFRPNPIGLSCVKLVAIEGNELVVAGADLMDGTPILDIKPYLPYADARPDAAGGFAEPLREYALKIDFPETLMERVPEELRDGLCDVISQDPRPSYQDDPERIYGFAFASLEIRFRVNEDTLTVLDVQKQ